MFSRIVLLTLVIGNGICMDIEDSLGSEHSTGSEKDEKFPWYKKVTWEDLKEFSDVRKSWMFNCDEPRDEDGFSNSSFSMTSFSRWVPRPDECNFDQASWGQALYGFMLGRSVVPEYTPTQWSEAVAVTDRYTDYSISLHGWKTYEAYLTNYYEGCFQTYRENDDVSSLSKQNDNRQEWRCPLSRPAGIDGERQQVAIRRKFSKWAPQLEEFADDHKAWAYGLYGYLLARRVIPTYTQSKWMEAAASKDRLIEYEEDIHGWDEYHEYLAYTYGEEFSK